MVVAVAERGDDQHFSAVRVRVSDADKWYSLYEWLRDNALVVRRDIEPSSEEIRDQFGPSSPLYERDIDTLRALYGEFSGYETVGVKRRLWEVVGEGNSRKRCFE